MDLGPVRIERYRPRLDPAALAGLRARLAAVRAPAATATTWEQGVAPGWLGELVRDWLHFDTGSFESELAALPHYLAEIAGQRVHLIHLPGRGPDPLPLLLTHGWPGSFLEYLPVLSRLTDPQAHGGDPADSFTVIVPSLPGFGFSGAPAPGGLGSDAVASLWHQLMTDGLGFDRYVAHGSDLGAGITARVARAHPESVAGIHLATPGLVVPAGPLSPAEEAFAAATARWVAEEGGYAHLQSTKPATLGVALADSPVGLAAWIGEKIVSWSPVDADGGPAFDRQLLLGTLTLYWATDTIASSLLPYWAGRHRPVTDLAAAPPAAVPTAISIFGGERVPFPKPPRELAARFFQLSHWAEHDRGGHFPAVAEPELLTDILRERFRPLRGA
jgi:pimeloyl-ACP methyl ester carboxylesterase